MKTLVILTLEYPDPILEKELPYLSAAFEKIYILPQSVGRMDAIGNVEVRDIFEDKAGRSRWRLLLRHAFTLLNLFSYSFQFSSRMNYARYHRSIIGHFLNEICKLSPLKNFIIQNNLQDAIFYDYWLVDATIALALLKRRGLIRKTIARTHGFDLYDERQFEGVVSFREFRIEHLDAVFAISEHGYEYLRNRLPEHLREKVRLSRLGVADPGPPAPKKRYKDDAHLIVSCARLIPLKRILVLAECLRTTRMDICWIHFGDGPARKEVEEAVQHLPKNVVAEIRGNVQNDEVLKFYREFHVDLFVSLSETEGIPVSMMEAISAGIPVFSCSVNGIPELVNETTGKLIPLETRSIDILRELEQTLQKNTFDPQVVYGAFNKHFNASHNINQFISAIQQLFNLPASQKKYQECTQCVLSTDDDPYITFDATGVCQYCRQYSVDTIRLQKAGKPGTTAFEDMINTIKRAGQGRKYDCIIGISGGVDSTYLAYLAKASGLRPLAVHFDNGWNSELAVMNIEKIVTKLDLDLHTLIVEWDEFRDLQTAFLKASVIDIELVTDHAMLATLYRLALKNKIRYILSGHNQVTEAVLPKHWYHDKRDHVHIRSIHALFGTIPLKTFPQLDTWLKFRVEWSRIKSVSLLDYIPYNSHQVREFLVQELGWRDYGGKHYESVFTRFYQGYILPRKFGVDKRRAHLSNLICAGQISRDEAIAQLAKPTYSPELQKQDYEYVMKKLQLSEETFQQLLEMPVKLHTDYPVDVSLYERFRIFKLLAPFWRFYKKFRNSMTTTE